MKQNNGKMRLVADAAQCKDNEEAMSKHCGCTLLHQYGDAMKMSNVLGMDESDCLYPASLEAIRRLRETLAGTLNFGIKSLHPKYQENHDHEALNAATAILKETEKWTQKTP